MEPEESSPFFYRCRIRSAAKKEQGEESGSGASSGRSSREVHQSDHAVGNQEKFGDGLDGAETRVS